MISIIIVIYNIPRQAENTLFSLSCAYQKNVAEDDYEVIVIENESDNILGEARTCQFGSNFRYQLNHKKTNSPAHAINLGLSMAAGNFIGIIIDGARIITPRVIEYAMMAYSMSEHALVTVPAYHLGLEEQSNNIQARHSENVEIQKLAELDWKNNGYRLFEFACFGPSNRRGYLQPMQESSTLFASKEKFGLIGGADESFDLPGGGSLGLHIYRQLGMLPESELYILPGEGSFHQFHRGVTTSEIEKREDLLAAFKEQLDQKWGGKFFALRREPILLGSVTYLAQRFLGASAESAKKRFDRLSENGSKFWPDDEISTRHTENMTSDSKERKTWEVQPINPPKYWA